MNVTMLCSRLCLRSCPSRLGSFVPRCGGGAFDVAVSKRLFLSPISSRISSKQPSRSLTSALTLLTGRNVLSTITQTQNVIILPCLHISKRFMAKGKDRKKEKKTSGDTKPKVLLDDEEMEKVIQFEELKVEVESILDEMKNDLKLSFNVRLNPRQIESLEISYDGVKVALADIVTIARKQQDLVINFAATPNAVKPAMVAILESGLNLNPQQDGNLIYIRTPKVTTEHRAALIKAVKALGQKTKDRLKDRNFHKRFYLKTGADAKKVSQDLQNDVTANLNYYIKQKSGEIDEIVAQKADSLANN